MAPGRPTLIALITALTLVVGACDVKKVTAPGAPDAGEADAGPDAQPEADAAPDTRPEPDAEPDTEPQPDAAPDAGPDLAPDVRVDPEPLEIAGTWLWAGEGGARSVLQLTGERLRVFEPAEARVDWLIDSHDNATATFVAGEDGAWSAFVWSEADADGARTLCQAGPAATVEDAWALADPCEGGTSLSPVPEIAGAWHTNWQESLTIDAEAWSYQTLHWYDDAENRAIVQNPADDPWNPSKFAVWVWTEPDETRSFWGCTVAFGLETLEEAQAAELDYDDSDPAVDGCGGFSWTRYFPPLEAAGGWADGDAQAEVEVSSWAWGAHAVAWHHNPWPGAPGWAVLDAFDGTYALAFFSQGAEGALHVCEAADGLASVEAALALEAPDADDPDAGCAGGPWALWTPALGVRGRWATNYGYYEDLSSFAWSFQAVVEYGDGWAITQNAEDDEWFPSAFSKMVWTSPGDDGRWWYCTADYGLETLEEAQSTTAEADATDPASGGCGGFPWTLMREPLPIEGDWILDEAVVSVTSFLWGDDAVYDWSSSERWVGVAHDEGEGVPASWIRVDWYESWDGTYWCQRGGFESFEAVAAAEPADSLDPANAGCEGGPWTVVTPASASE